MATVGGVAWGDLHLPSYEWSFPFFSGIYCDDGMRHEIGCREMMPCSTF